MDLNISAAIDYGREVLRVEQIAPSDLASAVGSEINGRKVIATIYGNDYDKSPVVSYGQVLCNEQETLVVIRGTSTLQEWLDDATFPLVNCGFMEGRAEQGFLSIYRTLRIAINEGSSRIWESILSAKNLVIAGHSLGAALATLLAAETAKNGGRPITYTFASPCVGDDVFADTYRALGIETHRVFYKGDLVPEVPRRILPLFPYQHVGMSHELIDLKERSIPCRHHLQNYLHILSGGQLPLYSGCE